MREKAALKRKTLLVFCICLLVCLVRSPAHGLDIQREIFMNGLTLLVVERQNLPIVRVSVGIAAGSLKESEEKAGLANLTAVLLTSGTTTRTEAEINEEIEYVGASLNGSGGDDYITMNLSVLKKDIHLGFDLLSDVLLNPSFPEDQLDKKKERIKGGLRAQEEDPGFVALKRFRKAVFGSHPYGRLVTGSPETLDEITRSDLMEFHNKYYTPNNAIMSVVGQVTINEVKTLLERYFDEWEERELGPPVPMAPETTKKKEMVIINKDLTQANLILGHAGIPRNHPDYYAVSVMNYILGGGGFASRLMQNIREEKGLAYDIRSFFASDRYSGTFQVGLQTMNETANKAIEEILREMRRIREQSVTDEELSDAKAFLVGSFPIRIETNSKIARFLVAVEFYELGTDYIEKYPVYIDGITKDDVLRVAREYIDPEHFILVVVANEKKASIKKEFSGSLTSRQ